jgi:hypothetical protein
MSFAPTSPVTGAAVTGLTSPTYTLTQVSGPDVNWKRFAVTTLGGTQTSVRTHGASDPFYIEMSQPKVLKPRPSLDPGGMYYKGVGPKNVYGLRVVKGGIPVTGAPPEMALFRGEFAIPSGVESVDLVNLKAMLSLIGGVLFANALAVSDTFGQGTV